MFRFSSFLSSNILKRILRENILRMLFVTKASSEPCQTSKMVRFVKRDKSFYKLSISAKRSILDV